MLNKRHKEVYNKLPFCSDLNSCELSKTSNNMDYLEVQMKEKKHNKEVV